MVWLTLVCQPCSAGWWGPACPEDGACPYCGERLTLRGRTVVVDL